MKNYFDPSNRFIVFFFASITALFLISCSDGNSTKGKKLSSSSESTFSYKDFTVNFVTLESVLPTKVNSGQTLDLISSESFDLTQNCSSQSCECRYRWKVGSSYSEVREPSVLVEKRLLRCSSDSLPTQNQQTGYLPNVLVSIIHKATSAESNEVTFDMTSGTSGEPSYSIDSWARLKRFQCHHHLSPEGTLDPNLKFSPQEEGSSFGIRFNFYTINSSEILSSISSTGFVSGMNCDFMDDTKNVDSLPDTEFKENRKNEFRLFSRNPAQNLFELGIQNPRTEIHLLKKPNGVFEVPFYALLKPKANPNDEYPGEFAVSGYAAKPVFLNSRFGNGTAGYCPGDAEYDAIMKDQVSSEQYKIPDGYQSVLIWKFETTDYPKESTTVQNGNTANKFVGVYCNPGLNQSNLAHDQIFSYDCAREGGDSSTLGVHAGNLYQQNSQINSSIHYLNRDYKMVDRIAAIQNQQGKMIFACFKNAPGRSRVQAQTQNPIPNLPSGADAWYPPAIAISSAQNQAIQYQSNMICKRSTSASPYIIPSSDNVNLGTAGYNLMNLCSSTPYCNSSEKCTVNLQESVSPYNYFHATPHTWYGTNVQGQGNDAVSAKFLSKEVSYVSKRDTLFLATSTGVSESELLQEYFPRRYFPTKDCSPNSTDGCEEINYDLSVSYVDYNQNNGKNIQVTFPLCGIQKVGL